MHSVSQTEDVAVRVSFGDDLIDIPFGNILQEVSVMHMKRELNFHTLIWIGMESSPTNSRRRFIYSSLLGRTRKSSKPGSGRMMNMNSCPRKKHAKGQHVDSSNA